MTKIEKILAQAKNILPKWRATMNVSTKTMPWMVASLLAATSIFGQNQGGCAPQPQVCKPVPPPKCGPLQAPQQPTVCAYNAPAEINIGMQGDIDFFASGSFIYWQPSQDNMAFSFVSNKPIVSSPGATSPSETTIKGSFVEQNFKFKPGFKVGLGMNLQTDDWDGYVEYTRVHGTHHTSTSSPPSTPEIFATFGHQFTMNTTVGATNIYNSANSHYRNNLDIGDVEMGRKYYVGKNLMFRSAWGARTAWILQNIHLTYKNTNPTAPQQDTSGEIASNPGVLNVYQRSHSWSVGPRAGLCMDWMLGCGVRFFGSGYGDILYTKYKIQDKSVYLPFSSLESLLVGVPYSVIGRDKVGLLRTHFDLEMGLGWGSYFDNNNWHVDFSASYGWQVFFDQNMFRQSTSIRSIGMNTIANGNLYVQGLTATLRVDF